MPARVAPRRAAWLRYALPFVAVALATLLTYGLYVALGAESVRVVFVFYFAAVFYSTRRGGLGPGLLAIGLSAILGNYRFFDPPGFVSLDLASVLQTFLFMSVALLLVYLIERGRSVEEEVRHSEEFLSTTLKSIGDAVITTDAEGRVAFLNAVAEALTGWTGEEARGRDLGEVFRIVNEETRAVVESPLVKVMREGGAVGLANHTVLLSKDGREIPIDDSGAPIKDAGGRIVGVVLVFQDITERRKNEAALLQRERELTNFIEHAPVGLHWVGADGTILWANRAELEMLGYDAEEYIGHNIAEFHADSEVIEDILHRLTDKEVLHEYEARLRTKDSSIRHVQITSNVMWSDDGKFVHTRCFTRDITERRQAEEARARLADIVDSSEDAILSKTLGGTITSWNTAAQKLYGYTAEELVGKSVSILIPPELKQELHEILERIKNGGKVEHHETVRVTKDGERVDVSVTISPIKSASGEVVGASTIARDITDRRRVEEHMRESELRYRALADAMPQIVWTARPDGYLDYYNRRWFKYTGMSFEETRGWGWQPVLHPDDVEHALRTWATCVETGEPYRIEYRFRRASDGLFRWHLGRAEPLRDAEGRIVKWFGTATDIHDQKQAEERLRFLTEAGALLASSLDYEATLARLARLGVAALADFCIIDLVEDDGSLKRVATAHIDPAREELTAELRRFPPARGRGEGPAKAIHTNRTEIVSHVTEEKLRTLVRSEEHAEVLRQLGLKSFMSVPLVTRGRTIGALTFTLAGTERAYTPTEAAFAEELARLAAIAIDNARLYGHAREINRAKDEFLATLSHELRTPLTPIIGWTHMIRNGHVKEADAEQGLRVIDKNSQALSRLINDLLDMSSILSGKMRIERVQVALGAVVREAVETTRPLAEARGVSFELEGCDDALPVNVYGDRTRLVQVFWNLLNNAVKFSTSGGRVRVECRMDESAAYVDVSDDGQGIASGFLPHVFERFRQADGSTTRAYGGLGIGLALVKSFVEAHGGNVSATSDGEGLGSRFTVSLPLVRHAATESAPPVEPPAEEVGACVEEESCHVLLVEDARDTLEMLRVVFGARGYHTTACETAEEALRIAESTRFDIIVSDIGLPRIDGYELIRRLRRMPHFRAVPALALTGYAAPKDAESALAAGFDAHVPKPIDPSALAEEMEQLLQQKARPEETEP
jgi:PAS domain S-box-containing protein